MRFYRTIGTFVFGAAVSTGVHYHMDNKLPNWISKMSMAATPIPSQTRPNDIMALGFPGTTNLKMRHNYVLSYDRRLRNPIWVVEHLTKDNTCKTENTVDRSKFDFSEDSSVPAIFRATNKDYYKSGFDRGHLAAAANHRSHSEWMEETFLLTNISPQKPKLNQITWNNLEKYTRSLCHHYEDVFVCSGPLFLPQRSCSDGKLYVTYQVLEPNHVAVPTHFFKVIVCQKKGNFDLQCYVMPNEDLVDPDQPIANFLTPLDAVEKASGLSICQALPKDRLRMVNKQKVY